MKKRDIKNLYDILNISALIFIAGLLSITKNYVLLRYSAVALATYLGVMYGMLCVIERQGRKRK